MLQYDTIISESGNDIGQTNLIAMKPDAALLVAQPYPLALINIIVVVKKYTPEGAPQQFHLCIDYEKVNSLLPPLTPSMDTKKGTFVLMPLPRID